MQHISGNYFPEIIQSSILPILQRTRNFDDFLGKLPRKGNKKEKKKDSHSKPSMDLTIFPHYVFIILPLVSN